MNKINRTLTKEKFELAVKDFRSFLKDKKNHSYHHPEFGNKIEGKLKFRHFIFYAMLKNRDIEKTTHDVSSEKYLVELDLIKKFRLNSDFLMCFPSLSEEEIKEIIINYFK